MDKSGIPDLESLLPSVIELAEQAGSKIMEFYKGEYHVESKEDLTPLTDADLAAHTVIDNGLKALTPDIPVLSEESTEIPFSERANWLRYWLVDPLDGTREFIKHNGEFTVNIAFIDNHKVILGVVYAPALGVCYYATEGQGAHKCENGGAPERIKVQSSISGKVTIAGSRSHRGASLDSFLSRLGEHEFTPMGSSLKSCLVAEGKADIYPRLGPTSEWDTAAAQCVVEEAGGHITDTQMQALRYNTKELLLNPYFFVFGDNSIDWASYLND
ncbi:MAG: 3'(2'),5'-bisphosphate nucleotidase CysQ [Gammaproteobacteria bacterium]|nr:3'(2'),5'-bisphosphate nucleotidase CysQ [Gammaproteobacteria bacterium]